MGFTLGSDIFDLNHKDEDLVAHNLLLDFDSKFQFTNYLSKITRTKCDMEFCVFAAFLYVFPVGIFAYSTERESDILLQERLQQLQV